MLLRYLKDSIWARKTIWGNYSRIIEEKENNSIGMLSITLRILIRGHFGQFWTFDSLSWVGSRGLEVSTIWDKLLLLATWLLTISRANVIRYVNNNEFNDLVESLITYGILLKIFNELAAFHFRIIRNFIQRIIKKRKFIFNSCISFGIIFDINLKKT